MADRLTDTQLDELERAAMNATLIRLTHVVYAVGELREHRAARPSVDDEIDALPLALQLDELCRNFAPNFRLVGDMRCDEVASVARLAIAGAGLSRELARSHRVQIARLADALPIDEEADRMVGRLIAEHSASRPSRKLVPAPSSAERAALLALVRWFETDDMGRRKHHNAADGIAVVKKLLGNKEHGAATDATPDSPSITRRLLAEPLFTEPARDDEYGRGWNAAVAAMRLVLERVGDGHGKETR